VPRPSGAGPSRRQGPHPPEFRRACCRAGPGEGQADLPAGPRGGVTLGRPGPWSGTTSMGFSGTCHRSALGAGRTWPASPASGRRGLDGVEARQAMMGSSTERRMGAGSATGTAGRASRTFVIGRSTHPASPDTGRPVHPRTTDVGRARQPSSCREAAPRLGVVEARSRENRAGANAGTGQVRLR